MRLNNETKEVFKDPSPVQTLRDVGRVVGYGAGGGVLGVGGGAAAGLATAMAMGVVGAANIPLIVGGVAVGIATGAAVGVVMAIKKSAFENLVAKAKEVTDAPGFNRALLDEPIKGFEVGRTFDIEEKPTSHKVLPFAVHGTFGLAVAAVDDAIAKSDYNKMARDPEHRFEGDVGTWSDKPSLLREGEFSLRDARPATLRDVLEFKDPVVGKDILRELIETGRIDSFRRNHGVSDDYVAAAENVASRLSGFMKSTLKTDAPSSATSVAKPG